MLEIKLARISLLKNIVEVVKMICEQGMFVCSRDHVAIQAMDGSHIAFVDLRLGRGVFESFKCDNDVAFTIPFERLLKALKCSEPDDSGFLRYANGDTLQMLFYNSSNDKKKEFDLKLSNNILEVDSVPRIPIDGQFVMKSAEFQKTCRNHASFGESIELELTSTAIKCKSESREDGIIETSFNRDDVISIVARDRDDLRSNFSLQYLLPMSKGSLLAENVKISLGAGDMPIMLNFELGEDSYLKFFLAHKLYEL